MRKGCLIAGAVGIFGTFGAAVYGLYWAFTGYVDYGPAARELPRAVREYRATGLPFTAREVAPPRLLPKDNPVPALRAAIRLAPRAKDDTLMIAAMRRPDAAAEALVARFAKPLALIEGVRDRKEADFGRDWDRGPDVALPEYRPMKSLARTLALRAVRAAQRGDDAAARRDLDLARQLGMWAYSEPSLLSGVVRISLEGIVQRGAELCLASAKGDAARIAAYRAWLATAPPPPDFRRGLRGEAWFAVATMRNLDRFGGKEAMEAERIARYDPRTLRRGDALPTETVQRASMTRVLQAWTEVHQRGIFAMSSDRAGAAMDALEDEWADRRGLSRIMVSVLSPSFGTAGRAYVGVEGRRRVTLAYARALEIQAQTGAWPASVPEIDPFIGKPLHVKRSATEFRVWSVGRDGRDDGGLTRREKRKETDKRSDDVAAYPPTEG